MDLTGGRARRLLTLVVAASVLGAACTSPAGTSRPGGGRSGVGSSPGTAASMDGTPQDTTVPDDRLPRGVLGPFPVVKVVDGDTVRVARSGRRVTLRLIGIDTPETKDPRRPVECFGREASVHVSRLVAGRGVYLELDGSQGELDRFGRTLAYVWVLGRRATLVNERMIADGFAFEYTYRLPYRYQRRFRAAEADARRHSRGLWSPATCAGDPDRAERGQRSNPTR